MRDAETTLKHGQRYPYDAPDSWWADSPPVDWAHAAARGILADLTIRRELMSGFKSVDNHTRAEIVTAIAEIIRVASKAGVTQ
jgi:hypothetical protein